MMAQRRLLLLSYWVPPRNAIGTIRSAHILKHMPAFGWNVDAITARFEPAGSPDPIYLQTGYWDVKNALKRLAGIGNRSTSAALNLNGIHYGGKPGIVGRAFRMVADLATYPDEYVGWLPFALPSVRSVLASGRYHALLTSSPPVTTNLIAALAHGRTPWFADLRDLWAEDDSRERSQLLRTFDDKLERASLQKAVALIASSARSAERFRKRYPGKPVFSISTGFDPDDWNGIAFAREPQCTLVYAGSLYSGRRDPRTLFSALRSLFEEGLASPNDLRADFYCEPEAWLRDMIADFKLDEVVRVRGCFERGAVLAAQRRADRLLLFSWAGATAEGVVPGKIFEYFGARRPILAIGGTQQSTVQDLLEETGAGIRCITAEEVKADLLHALEEHRGKMRIVPAEAAHQYTSEQCAMRFAKVLDSVLGERTGMRYQDLSPL